MDGHEKTLKKEEKNRKGRDWVPYEGIVRRAVVWWERWMEGIDQKRSNNQNVNDRREAEEGNGVTTKKKKLISHSRDDATHIRLTVAFVLFALSGPPRIVVSLRGGPFCNRPQLLAFDKSDHRCEKTHRSRLSRHSLGHDCCFIGPDLNSKGLHVSAVL
jgi:hypothetical protein